VSTHTTSKAIADTHEEEHDAEGNSIAAWTAVIIMLVAFAVGTIGFCFALPVVVWIAAAFEIIGLLVGQILKRMGFGVGGHRYVPKAHN
jgi:flagellar biosynthesis protein FliP